MIQTQDYLRELITIFFIRKKIILAVSLIFFAGGVLIAFFWPAVYEATGSIIVKRNVPLSQPTSVEDTKTEITRLREENIISELEIIQSRTVVQKTVERLKDKGIVQGSGKRSGRKMSRIIGDMIEKNLKIRRLPSSNVIKIKLTWDDPKKAEKILKTYFQQYISYRSELYSSAGALSFFENQFQNYQTKLEEKEKELMRLAEKNNISDPSEQIGSNLSLQQTLETRLMRAETQVNTKRKRIQRLQETLASEEMHFFSSLDDNRQISGLSEKLQSLFLQKQELLDTYTPQSSKVQGVETQIQAVYDALKTEVHSYLQAEKAALKSMMKNVEALKTRLKELRERNMALYKNSVLTKRIKRKMGLLEESFSKFAKRMEEARIKKQTKTQELLSVGTLSTPHAKVNPVFPQKRKVIPLGILLGLIVGCTAGFLTEFFDHSFKRREDVYAYTDMPHIFSVPKR